MRIWKVGAPLSAALMLMLGACGGGGGANVCEKPKLYQSSQPGKRIEVPEDLDSLNSTRELSIPDASPRDPRPAGAPCLELPPSYGSDDDSSPAG